MSVVFLFLYYALSSGVILIDDRYINHSPYEGTVEMKKLV